MAKWHPVTEKPEKDGWIIEDRGSWIQGFKYNSKIDWENHVKQEKIKQWIYQEEWEGRGG